MAQRDLKLNTLGRSGKDSNRLVLEEHGHCEVPAGCGGAVLRWRNPNTGLLFIFTLFSTCKTQLLIDGSPPSSGRPLIPFGDHVLSIVCSEITLEKAVVGFAALHDETQFGFPRVSRPSGRKIAILSAADGSWKYSTSEPAGDLWMRPEFDDSTWSSMVMPAPSAIESDKTDIQSYRLNQVLKAGASLLGFDQSQPRVWIRKVFSLTQPA